MRTGGTAPPFWPAARWCRSPARPATSSPRNTSTAGPLRPALPCAPQAGRHRRLAHPTPPRLVVLHEGRRDRIRRRARRPSLTEVHFAALKAAPCGSAPSTSPSPSLLNSSSLAPPATRSSSSSAPGWDEVRRAGKIVLVLVLVLVPVAREPSIENENNLRERVRWIFAIETARKAGESQPLADSRPFLIGAGFPDHAISPSWRHPNPPPPQTLVRRPEVALGAGQALAMDVDGVWPDGAVRASPRTAPSPSPSPSSMAWAWSRPSTALASPSPGISGRPSGAAARRAEELKVAHHPGSTPTSWPPSRMAGRLHLEADACVYIGAMTTSTPRRSPRARIGVSVPDAMPAAVAAADLITRRPAGRGAVREISRRLPPGAGSVLPVEAPRPSSFPWSRPRPRGRRAGPGSHPGEQLRLPHVHQGWPPLDAPAGHRGPGRRAPGRADGPQPVPFTGDARNRVETIILSPTAVADLETDIIAGPGRSGFIRDDLEIARHPWRYDHRGKKVSITRNSRVVFQAQMPDILK